MTSTTDAISQRLKGGEFVGTWVLEPAGSTVKLKTKAMFGVVPVKGTFDKVSGSATVTAAGDVVAEIAADAATLSTKMKKRDEHLRSADFFDVTTHPTMTVAITGVDAGLNATGTLTVKGRSVPLAFPVTVAEATATRLTLDASFVVDRSELGIDFSKMGATKMLNTVTVHAVFTRS